MGLYSNKVAEDRYNFIVQYQLMCKEENMQPQIFFPIDRDGNIRPSGIVDAEGHFVWYCPNGDEWKIDGVKKLTLQRTEECSCSFVNCFSVFESYDDAFFNSLTFFIEIEAENSSEEIDLLWCQGKRIISHIKAISEKYVCRINRKEEKPPQFTLYYSKSKQTPDKKRGRKKYEYFLCDDTGETCIGSGEKCRVPDDIIYPEIYDQEHKVLSAEEYLKNRAKVNLYLDNQNRVMRSKCEPDSYGLYPDEIAALVLLDGGERRWQPGKGAIQVYPAFLSDINKIYRDLQQRGFIEFDSLGSGVKIAEWNNIQRYYSKVCRWKKSKTRNAVISELLQNVPASDLEKAFPNRALRVSLQGLEAIDKHPGIEFAILTDHDTRIVTATCQIYKGAINIWNVEKKYSEDVCAGLRDFYYTAINEEHLEIDDFPNSYKVWSVLYNIMLKSCKINIVDKCDKITVGAFLEKYSSQFPHKIYDNWHGKKEKGFNEFLDMSLTELSERARFMGSSKYNGTLIYKATNDEITARTKDIFALLMDMT